MSSLSASVDSRLSITHGLQGSGKSFVSQAVLEEAGAIRVRSDVERKRLFRLGALQSSHQVVSGGIYDKATTERTNSRLPAVEQLALGAGSGRMSSTRLFCTGQSGSSLPNWPRRSRCPSPSWIAEPRCRCCARRLEQRRASGANPSEADVAALELLSQTDEPLDERDRAISIVVDAARPGPRRSLSAGS